MNKCKGCGHDVEEHNNYQGCMNRKGNSKIGYKYCMCRMKHDSLVSGDEK